MFPNDPHRPEPPVKRPRAAAPAIHVFPKQPQFIAEASRLYVEALTNNTDDMDDVTGLVGLYAMVGRMRLVSDQPVIDAAMGIERTIIETYLGPDETVRELMVNARQGKMSFLVEFSEACRKDLVARITAIR